MKYAAAILLIVSLLGGCAGVYRESWPNDELAAVISPDPLPKPKYIFVLFDGTRNDKLTETNVARVSQLLRYEERPENRVLYVSGVGATDKPLSGSALGRGMEERILLGYQYVMRHHEPGDKLIIMGFSRGAHQARSLAGMLAYSGIPRFAGGANQDIDLMALGNAVIEFTKSRADEDYIGQWKAWTPADPRPMLDRCDGEASECVSKKVASFGVVSMRPIQVDFLGVWDTVPGSSFKEFDKCKEKPDEKEGDRYKSHSYPPIRRISHAVSIDEKRDKFQLLQICDAINPAYTDATQMWFPGAHADVGGGYSDSRLLSGLSLNWMLAELSETYPHAAQYPRMPESATALAHWSIGDKPANVGSECRDRIIEPGDPVHSSYLARKDSGPVPIRANFYRKGMDKTLDEAKYYLLPYPIECPGPSETDF